MRDVAMSAKREELEWADRLRLALFAPAHMGANVIGLMQMGSGFVKWGGVAQAIAIAKFPVLRDLQPESTYLKGLLAEAKEIGVHSTTKARFVAHADGDWVVLQDAFFRDPPPLPYVGTDHVGCCKPKRGVFELPLKDIAAVLT